MSEYLYRFINSTRPEFVHKNNIVNVQEWIYTDGLQLTNKDLNEDSINNKPNEQYNEYYLSTVGPIKTFVVNDKHYIVDGHHRFYRSLERGYEYILVNRSVEYNPISFEKPKSVKIFVGPRPDDNYIDKGNYHRTQIPKEMGTQVANLMSILNITSWSYYKV